LLDFVDDRLADGLADLVGRNAHIRHVFQRLAFGEIKKRGWDMKNVGAVRVSYEQLPTAVDRVEGAMSVLKSAGFPAEKIY
ncbi:arabinose ABC transporter substrate-binding protein, partial [Rhizobium ruizarguesonis]